MEIRAYKSHATAIAIVLSTIPWVIGCDTSGEIVSAKRYDDVVDSSAQTAANTPSEINTSSKANQDMVNPKDGTGINISEEHDLPEMTNGSGTDIDSNIDKEEVGQSGSDVTQIVITTTDATIDQSENTDAIVQEESSTDTASIPPDVPGESMENDASFIFLHKSTGEYVWYNGNVTGWIDNYNSAHGTNYRAEQMAFPVGEPYWVNMPQQYWDIWINHAGPESTFGEPTLEVLTQTYDMVIWKHCFPVSDVVESGEAPDVASMTQTIDNYKLQYNALKTKMRSFPDTRFLIWTGAAQTESQTSYENAVRAQSFFDWVRNTWDEPGDNIYLWDFRRLETEGGLYLKPEYAVSAEDAHPNGTFCSMVGPFFGQRIVDVIEGRGDSSSRTGQ